MNMKYTKEETLKEITKLIDKMEKYERNRDLQAQAETIIADLKDIEIMMKNLKD